MTESEQHPASVPEPGDEDRDMEVRYVKPGEDADTSEVEGVVHDGVTYRPPPRAGEARVVEGGGYPDPVVATQPKAESKPEDEDEWATDRFGAIYPPAGGAMTGTVLPPADATEEP